ncbi:MAG: hypothetical protein GAK45_01234 [Pseudomonas citronellolis]|nr:MAG: hypothetical protein GAK45_01234 [Pseudomonas citronellolis]
MEDLRQLDVIVLATRAIAQLAELEPGHVITGQSRTNLAVLDAQRVVAGGGGAIRRQRLEVTRHGLIGLLAERPVVKLGLLEGAQTVIDAAIDVDHFGVLLDQRDRRQEAGTLQAVFVETVWHDVGGRDQAHAILEQLVEQGGKNHRVGNVGDEELVEADHPGLVGETLADDGQWVLLALEGLHFLVHTLHEAVEVRPHLLLEGQCVEEGVHQIGLAAPYPAPEVQALDRPAGLLAEQFAEQARLGAAGRHQVVVQALQMLHGIGLCCIVEEIGAFEVFLVAL